MSDIWENLFNLEALLKMKLFKSLKSKKKKFVFMLSAQSDTISPHLTSSIGSVTLRAVTSEETNFTVGSSI